MARTPTTRRPPVPRRHTRAAAANETAKGAGAPSTGELPIEPAAGPGPVAAPAAPEPAAPAAPETAADARPAPAAAAELATASGPVPAPAAEAPRASEPLAHDVAALLASGYAWVEGAERISRVFVDLACGAIAGGLETQRAWRDFQTVEDAMRAQADWAADGFAATVEGAGSIVLAAAEVADRSMRPLLERAVARVGSLR